MSFCRYVFVVLYLYFKLMPMHKLEISVRKFHDESLRNPAVRHVTGQSQTPQRFSDEICI